MELLELKKRLYTKVETLAQSIGKMQKDGNNTFHRFKYITHEQVSTEVRSESIQHQISIVADMVDYTETMLPVDNKGRIGCRTVVKMLFTITDLETGHQEAHTFFGAAQDTEGKSMQKGISLCNKYFLFKLLKITDKGEDNDGESNEVIVTPPPPKKEAVKKPVKGKVRELVMLVKKLKTINNDKMIKEYYASIPENERPNGFKEECVKRNKEINKVDTYKEKSTKKGVEYTITHSIANSWACTCPVVSKAGEFCKHIKVVQARS